MRGSWTVTDGVPEPADAVFAYRSCTDDGNPWYAIWRWQIAPDGDGASRVTVSWDLPA